PGEGATPRFAEPPRRQETDSGPDEGQARADSDDRADPDRERQRGQASRGEGRCNGAARDSTDRNHPEADRSPDRPGSPEERWRNGDLPDGRGDDVPDKAPERRRRESQGDDKPGKRAGGDRDGQPDERLEDGRGKE